MELNNEAKVKLRSEILEQLQNVQNGQRVHIDKDLLEELLFETIVCNKETGEVAKLPIWSGPFLKKIDLSEVSFDNVAWSLMTVPGYEVYYKNLDDEACEKLTIYIEFLPNEITDYSYTNAKIDFSVSWEAKRNGGKFNIYCCNFSGVDLSNNDMSQLNQIIDSDISNTGIILTPKILVKPKNQFSDTNLTGVNLEQFTIDWKDFTIGSCFFDKGCNLSYTGINILINRHDMDITSHITDGHLRQALDINEGFWDMFFNGYLDGCNINGKMISGTEKSQEMTQEKEIDSRSI